MNTTSMLAEFITKSRLEDCPEAALVGARRAILDCLGVMLAGSVEPAARILQRVAQAEGGLPVAGPASGPRKRCATTIVRSDMAAILSRNARAGAGACRCPVEMSR